MAQTPTSHPILVQIFFQGNPNRIYVDQEGLYHHTADPNIENDPDDNWTQSSFASLISIDSTWTYKDLLANLEDVLITYKERSLAAEAGCDVTSVEIQEVRIRWKGTQFVTGEKALFSVVGKGEGEWKRVWGMLAERGWKDVVQIRYDAA